MIFIMLNFILMLPLPGADLGLAERGAKPSSVSLKQGVWGHSPPEAIGCLIL